MAVTFDALMKGFGVVTVMNACIFVPKTAYTAEKNCKTAAANNGTVGMNPSEFVPAYEYLDTLKIANITQEGPTKTVSGGQYANPLIKYGKTATCEIQDALGRASTMVRFFGCDYDGYEEGYLPADLTVTIDGVAANDKLYVKVDGIPASEDGEVKATAQMNTDGNCVITFSGAKSVKGAFYTITKEGHRLSITDKFPGPFAIEGDTFFIDQKTGEKKHVYVFIPQFIPDAILTLTQDSEGDATVFDLNGTLGVTTVVDAEGKKSRDIFYEIREESFFKTQRESMSVPTDDDYQSGEITVTAAN